MSSTDQQPASGNHAHRSETRLDPAHVMQSPEREQRSLVCQGAAQPQVATVGTPGAAGSAAACIDQIQNQAAQLGAHLQRQRENLDHREAELNARTAGVENQVRSARLWLDQRQQELETRETQISDHEQTLRDRLAQLGLDIQDGTVAEVQGELTRQVAQLRRAEAELADGKRALAEQQMQIERHSAELDVRKRYLDNAEDLLDKEREGVAAVRRQLELERTQLEQQRQQRHDELAAQQTLIQNELSRERRILEDRCDRLAKREAAHEKLHFELIESQREVLEIRLATEEIWSELSGTVNPAVLTRSISQIRARLADHYSLAKADLARREEQLQELARRLVEQHEELAGRKTELNDWVARRHEEIERQAARVVAGAHKLDRRQAHDNDEKLRWQEERLGYQYEIRRLQARLQQLEPAAA